MKKRAIYAGTFDPLTRGHLNIISRSLSLVDDLVLAISNNDVKYPMFSIEQRKEMVKNDILSELGEQKSSRVKVITFDTLLVELSKTYETNIYVRGVRNVADFDYEVQIASYLKSYNSDLECIFLATDADFRFVSSRFVKEIALLGGDVSKFVTKDTEKLLIAKRDEAIHN